MSFWYDEAAKELFKGNLDLDADTFKVLLVDSDTTADTEKTVTNLAAFSDLSEADGATYARQTLTNIAVGFDAGLKIVQFTADPTTFSTLGANASTLQNVAAVIFVDNGSDATNLPVAYIDGGGFPFTPAGQTILITWPAGGLLTGTIS